MEADKAGTEHDFRMEWLGDGLHQVAMGVHGHIVHNSHTLVPSSVQLVKLAAEQVIETEGIEAASIDIVELGD